ncbi:glycosyltransferase family 4 protein [Acetobacter sacchari]|nr:glycosyltransferase family 1 protein [Acetobacter sacchari]
MQIALDARNIDRPNGTGVASYARALADAAERGGAQVAWLREDASPQAMASRHTASAKAVRFASALLGRSSVAVRTGARNDMLSDDIFRIAHVHFKIFGKLLPVRTDNPPDVMHWTCPLPVRMEGCKNIVTIHDLIPVLRPDLCDVSPHHMRRMLRSVMSNAGEIIVISDSVRQDILTTFPIGPERIHTLHQGVGISTELRKAAEKAGDVCPAGSFIYVGSIEKRKNVGRLIEAHGRSQTTRMLVLIGPDGYQAQEEMSAIGRHPHPDRVMRLPWIERPQLIRAISTARALAFPSLAEGFGLPIVESMLVGTPVLTTQGGATGEIAGDAAWFVNPESVDSIAYGLERLSADDALCERLTSAGYARAVVFDPAHYERRVADLYAQIMSNG